MFIFFLKDKDPYGIVPLENIKVRSVTGAKNTFELYSDTNEIKACKKTGNGQFVKGRYSVKMWGIM